MKLIEEKYNSKNLYVINASGTVLDISFLKAKPNVIYDDENYFINNKIVNKSAVIFLKNQKIDTIVTINSVNLADKLIYINKRS